MIGDGQEYEDRPVYDDDGEMIIWPTEDEEIEEFTEETTEEVATLAVSDDVSTTDTTTDDEGDMGLDDSAYEIDETVEDDEDRLEVQMEAIEDELVEDANIGDIQEANDQYNEAMDNIVSILTQAIENEEITAEMSADLQDATEQMETAKQTIVDLCDNPDATKSITDIEELKNNMVSANIDEIIDILTEGGTKPWLYKDDNNNVLMDGTNIPQVTAVVRKLNLIATDGEDESSIQLAPDFIKLVSSSDITLKGSQIKITGDTIIEGLVTANNNFVINSDGSISCKNADIQGSITGATIKGSEVIGTSFSVEGELTADTITANKINNAQYPSTLDDDIQIELDPTYGNDEAELAEGAVYQTVAGVLDALPKFLNGKCVSIWMRGDISENADFQNYTSGQIKFYLDGHTLYGYIRNYMSSAKLWVYGGWPGTEEGQIGVVHPDTGCAVAGRTGSIISQESSSLNTYSVKVYGSDNKHSDGQSNIVGYIGDAFASMYIENTTLVNCEVGYRGSGCARIHDASSDGVCSQYGFQTTSGAFITIANAAHCGGLTANTVQTLPGQIIQHAKATFAGGNQTTDPGKAPTTSTKKIVTIQSNSGDTYRSTVYNNWKKDNTARQGDYGYGDCNGCWFFGTQFNQFKGKSISKIELTIKRIFGGSYAAVPIAVKTHNYTSRPNGQPSYGSSCGSVSIAVGNSGKLTITNSTILNALSGGTIKGFGIQSTYNSSNYAVCSGSVTMKVTYTE